MGAKSSKISYKNLIPTHSEGYVVHFKGGFRACNTQKLQFEYNEPHFFSILEWKDANIIVNVCKPFSEVVVEYRTLDDPTKYVTTSEFVDSKIIYDKRFEWEPNTRYVLECLFDVEQNKLTVVKIR